MSHFPNCTRCGYSRPLDGRTLLSSQTACPDGHFPSRIELTADPPAGSATTRAGATSLPSQTNHSL